MRLNFDDKYLKQLRETPNVPPIMYLPVFKCAVPQAIQYKRNILYHGVSEFRLITKFRNHTDSCFRHISDGTPEPIISIQNPRSSESSIQNVTVHTMLLDGYTLVCLRVDSELFPFDGTGHFPILAGYDTATEEPLLRCCYLR